MTIYFQDPAPGFVTALASGKFASNVVVGRRIASGTITYSANPSEGDKIVINGVEFVAVDADPEGNQFEVGANLSATLDNIVAALSASTDPKVAVATYAKSGSTAVAITANVGVEAMEIEADGATVVEPAGGNGGDPINPNFESHGLVTIAGGNMAFDLPAGHEGQELTLYLKERGGTSNAIVSGSVNGNASATLTFDAVGEFAKLKFLGGTWRVIANTATLA